MDFSHTPVWQPLHCRGAAPNAIVLDYDFAHACVEQPADPTACCELQRDALRPLGMNVCPETVFRFVDDRTFLIGTITHWTEPAYRLELSQISWLNGTSKHHPTYIFTETFTLSGQSADPLRRLELQLAFAGWARWATQHLKRYSAQLASA